MGNRFLTFLSNMFTDLNLTDMETCYKVFRREAIQDITIQENRFGFEPEIVAKAAAKKLRIYETGISYDGRTYEEGKKNWLERRFSCIVLYFPLQRLQTSSPHSSIDLFIYRWCIRTCKYCYLCATVSRLTITCF